MVNNHCASKAAHLTSCLLGVMVCLLLAGCINITTELQPDVPDVQPMLKGSDCVPIIFAIGIGTARVDQARVQGKEVRAVELDRSAPGQGRPAGGGRFTPITKIRRIQFTDYVFLGLGARCLEVIGEP
jgi:hypothetical protein